MIEIRLERILTNVVLSLLLRLHTQLHQSFFLKANLLSPTESSSS